MRHFGTQGCNRASGSRMMGLTTRYGKCNAVDSYENVTRAQMCVLVYSFWPRARAPATCSFSFQLLSPTVVRRHTWPGLAQSWWQWGTFFSQRACSVTATDICTRHGMHSKLAIGIVSLGMSMMPCHRGQNFGRSERRSICLGGSLALRCRLRHRAEQCRGGSQSHTRFQSGSSS